MNKPAEEVNKINWIAKAQQITTETTWMPYPDEEDKSTGSPPAEFFENEHYRQWKLAVLAEQEPSSSPEGSPLPRLRRRSSSQDISTKEELYLREDNNSRSL